MRIGVIGAGAVGGAIAALLARGGHSVEVTARGEHLAAIRSGGIQLAGSWGDYTAAVAANPQLAAPAELVIVTTKAQDAATAIASNAHGVDGAPILVVQNGLASLDTARSVAPESDIVGGLAMYAASFLSPGRVTITTPGVTYVGSGNAGDNGVPARYVEAVLGAVMPVEVTDNFVGAQWSKLVVNQINALPAITGMSAQEVIADGGLRRIMTASIRETVRVGFASGITFAPLQGLTNPLLRVIAHLPLVAAQALPLTLAKRMGATPNPGSTLQSIRRGQLSEIDYLNGAVVERGAALGIRTPVNATLVALVHDVERTGEFYSPAAVVARVRP
jgi:2-dehydropantoate 2-reductase